MKRSHLCENKCSNLSKICRYRCLLLPPTVKQKEAHRHNWNINRKIDNFFSELLQIEYAIHKHNKEKLTEGLKDETTIPKY